MPISPYESGPGITVLGVPVDAPGSLVAGFNKWQTATDTTIDLLKKLRQLPDGQMRHCLLRHCLDACRVTHLMRSNCRAAALRSAELLSQALWEAVADVVGCGLNRVAWEQATLPISKGGLGIRDPEQSWAEARLAATIGFHGRASAFVGLPEEFALTPLPDTPQVLSVMSTTLGPNHDPVSRWLADLSDAKQSWWAV